MQSNAFEIFADLIFLRLKIFRGFYKLFGKYYKSFRIKANSGFDNLALREMQSNVIRIFADLIFLRLKTFGRLIMLFLIMVLVLKLYIMKEKVVLQLLILHIYFRTAL